MPDRKPRFAQARVSRAMTIAFFRVYRAKAHAILSIIDCTTFLRKYRLIGEVVLVMQSSSYEAIP
jgi:hypothetical protein